MRFIQFLVNFIYLFAVVCVVILNNLFLIFDYLHFKNNMNTYIH